MNYKDYKRSRNAAWEILLACRVERLPVDLNAMLGTLGIRAYPYRRNEDTIRTLGLAEAAERTSGLTFYRGGEPVILYEDREPPGRIRFTVAHELGHLILGHVKPGEYTVQNREPTWTDSPMEMAANRFAVDLLAPACVLWGLGLHTGEEIAAVCGISKQAADFRAQRMEVLYQRGRFLTHPLEQRVFQQFQDYIREAQGRE